MNSIAYIAQSIDTAFRPPGDNPSIVKDSIQNLVTPLDKDSTNDVTEETMKTEQNTLLQLTKQQKHPPFIISIILFVPNLIIVKPLSFMWYIITFPLSLIEKGDTQPEEHEFEEKDEASEADRNRDRSLSNSTIVELDEETEKLIDPNSDPANKLKSPTSPSQSGSVLSRYKYLAFPKTVFPTTLVNSKQKKTLILDLDETLVHSLSRGTRMSGGHMVEVKLKDQVATLYYVHKRPYCDLFLKQVSKWFNLVIFTASVQEYADPVIDWLESERKYFDARYYRDHCTLRDSQGYIKDLAKVDKNLNNAIIIDNSPISYALHENNAILVEGWINDPTDTDLLSLIPLLSAMRYTTDVRTILALKNGEAAFER